MRIVVVEDLQGKRGRQAFFCTNPQWNVNYILTCYAMRWSIEVAFENGKQLMGFADPANRTSKAVERTAPMAFVLYGLIVTWFHEHGHPNVEFPHRPWYPQKQTPSFGDMLTTLRRLSWSEKTVPHLPHQGPLKNAVDQMTYFLSLARFEALVHHRCRSAWSEKEQRQSTVGVRGCAELRKHCFWLTK